MPPNSIISANRGLRSFRPAGDNFIAKLPGAVTELPGFPGLVPRATDGRHRWLVYLLLVTGPDLSRSSFGQISKSFDLQIVVESSFPLLFKREFCFPLLKLPCGGADKRTDVKTIQCPLLRTRTFNKIFTELELIFSGTASFIYLGTDVPAVVCLYVVVVLSQHRRPRTIWCYLVFGHTFRVAFFFPSSPALPTLPPSSLSSCRGVIKLMLLTYSCESEKLLAFLGDRYTRRDFGSLTLSSLPPPRVDW